MPVIIEISPLNPATGTRVPLRLAASDHADVTGLNNLAWWPGVASLPSLSMEAWDGDFSGTAQIASASFALDPVALRKNDANAPAFRWAGAPVKVWQGTSPDFAQWKALFTGLIDDYGTEEDGQYRFTAKVDSEPFEVDLMSRTYAGTGGAEGGDDLKGKVKPICLGYARNVEPVLLDSVNWVYQVHGYGPVQDIAKVYERGAEFVENGGTDVGDFASHAALVAANIPEGSYGTCLAEGMFRLGGPPAGLITCDVQGDNTGGWHRTTSAVIRRVAALAAVDSARLDNASLTALEAAVPYPINLYLTNSITLLDLVQQLAQPCNAQAIINWNGQLSVCRFGSIITPTVTLDAQGAQKPPVLAVQEMKASPPYWRIEMQGNRCWRPQSKDEIAYDFSSEGTPTYSDGTPIDNLRPAEPGATEGMTPTELDRFNQLEAAKSALAAAVAEKAAEISALQAQAAALQAAILAGGGDIESVQTILGSHGAQIGVLQTTVSNHTGQLASFSTSLTTAQSSITQNATAISGLNTSVASISSTLSTQGASISNNASAITSLQGQTATLSSSLNTAHANIAINANALTSLNGSFASLSSTVSSQGVSISNNAVAISNTQGNVNYLFGRWGVEIAVGGYISGVTLNNNGARSDAIFHVDYFAVGRPGSNTNYPFQIIGDQVFIRNAMIQDLAVTRLKIGNYAVDTTKLELNSVTQSTWATLPSDISLPYLTDVTILEVNVPNVAVGEILRVQALLSLRSNDDLLGLIRVVHTPPGGSATNIYIDDIKLDSDGGAATRIPMPVMARAVAGAAGTHNVKLVFRTTETSPHYARAGTDLEVIRNKR